ncbi:hypothetical protein AAHA92_31499 [Salvia divinorum]|uniref:Myb/SANT-like domain-containing protein n=1 Tax=Salvia divinorum TaxID=28513 RepID=A0ABD1FQH0_SALDI
MNFHIPKQAMFFYRGKWIQEIDSLLVSTLIEKKNDHRWDDASVPDYVLREVRKVINSRFGSELTCGDLVVRLKLLKHRYNTFKDVVATHGVHWNFIDKLIIANESTWKLIFERNPYAGAYYCRNEPEFNLMASMFGLFDVKVEDSHEVISLSDNTEVILISDSIIPNDPITGHGYASPVDADEVTSPLLGPTSRVRRKLFDVNESNSDQFSSTKSPSCFTSVKKVISSSPKWSSCASWSPLPISRKTGP